MSQNLVPEETLLDFEHLSPLICMELAAGLSDPQAVCEKYGLSEGQWLRLRENPTFQAMMKEAEKAFKGDLNAGKRITKKAEILLEEGLPILHRLMTNADASASTILDVMRQLGVLAGRTQRQLGETTGLGPGFNVSIEIHTSDPKKGVVIQGN